MSIIYYLVRESFHFRALEALRRRCREDPNPIHPNIEGNFRPLTIAENLFARLRDHSLWAEFLDSCSALELRAGYEEFKVVPVSRKLVEIPNGCNLPFLPSDYSSVEGTGLRRSQGIYNKGLTEKQFREHEGWFEVLGRDELAMSGIASYGYEHLQRAGQETGFAFYLPEMMPGDEKLFSCDQTRPLYLGRISSNEPSHLNGSHFASNCCLLQKKQTPFLFR